MTASAPDGLLRLTTVTVCTNEREWLGDCLGTLLASRTGSDLELEVVIVDNASSDGSVEFLEERLRAVRILRNESNLGFAGANNVGIRDALARGADLVMLVNPDTRTPPDLLRELAAFMRTWPQYGIVGPMQHVYTVDGSASAELNAWSRTALEAGDRHALYLDWPDHVPIAAPRGAHVDGTLEHSYVQGSALMCRAEVFEQVGLFDETYHTYYEETDLCRRARWAGWRVALIRALSIQHHGEGGTRTSTYRRRHMQRNKYYYLLTDPEWPCPRALRLVGRWVRSDLRGQGAVPTPNRRVAVFDTALGLSWLAIRVPHVMAMRRRHSSLIVSGLDARASRHDAG